MLSFRHSFRLELISLNFSYRLIAAGVSLEDSDVSDEATGKSDSLHLGCPTSLTPLAAEELNS